MPTDTLLYIGGCSGSFPVPTEKLPIWDPKGGGPGIRFERFCREKFGGRTTNYFLRHKDTFIMIDQGTGIYPSSRLLSGMLEAEGRKGVHLWHFQTHFHMDHIQGTPEYDPLYCKDMSLTYFSPDLSDFIRESERPEFPDSEPFMEHVFKAYFRRSGQYFPIPLDWLGSNRDHVGFHIEETLHADEIQVRTMALNHPNGCCGYRFEIPGVGPVVIVTDHEPDLEVDPRYVDFIDGAVLLLVDLQYSEEEYAGETAIGPKTLPRDGWGHGTPLRVLPNLLACSKPPRCVRVVHHDPRKSDTELHSFCDYCRDMLEVLGGAERFDFGFAHGADYYWL